MYLFGRNLLGIYLPDSPDAIYYGMIRLAWIDIPYFICGLMDVSTGGLRAMGSSVAPMIISILGVCGFRMLWIFTIFPKHHTLQCLFASYTISWILTFITQLFVFIHVYKKQRKKYQLTNN